MGSKRFVLMVEDNDDDVELTRRIISRVDKSMKVVVAKDGAQAMDFCYARGLFSGKEECLPSFVLLDLKLPYFGGEEVFRCLRGQDRTKQVPVVFVSASKEDIGRLQAANVGADAYLAKPVTTSSLRDLISRYG
jgi:two-component system, response regulator